MADEPWTARRVAERLAEAADTLARLPEARVRGYYSLWPPVARSARAALGGGGRARPIPPPPEAIDRMDAALAWLGGLAPEEACLVWLRAEGVPWKRVTARLGVGRTTAWQRWTVALLKLAIRLNAEDEQRCSNNKTLNKPARSVVQSRQDEVKRGRDDGVVADEPIADRIVRAPVTGSWRCAQRRGDAASRARRSR